MGGVFSNLVRVARTYNAENRAHKVLTEKRKVVPPRHKTTVPLLNQIKTDYAEKYAELLKKDEGLDKNLKDVFLTSTDHIAKTPRREESLPKRVTFESPFEYGYSDPDTVPAGKYTLTQVIEILTKHHQNQKENPVGALADAYKIDHKHLNNILKYYKLFRIEVKEDKKKTVMAESWSQDMKLGIRNIKQISASNKNAGKKQESSSQKKIENKT